VSSPSKARGAESQLPGRRPAYQALADQLRKSIRDREYENGRQLPTEADLAKTYGVSRQTVRRAYLDLVAEGLVKRTRGRGTFVVEGETRYLRQFGSIEDLLGFGRETQAEIVLPLTHGINIEAAARLGLADDVVYTVELLRWHRGLLFGWASVHLTPKVSEMLADIDELTTLGARPGVSIIELLERHLETPIMFADQTVTAVAATGRAAELLNVERGRPLLRIDRLFIDAQETPVELSVGYFLPEQYTYRARLRRVDQ
jgi:GntR family transcriptional regulator